MIDLETNTLIRIYRSERQYREAVKRHNAAKKTLQILNVFRGTNIPYDGFSCDADKTVEDLDVFQILQSVVDEQ